MRAKISREAVITEALALLNDEGLDEVSLRKLAARLAVKAPTLYGHVRSKAELYSLMGERIFRRCVEEVPAARDWQEWLRNFGKTYWAVLSQTRDAARLMMTGTISDEVTDEIVGQIVSTLKALGMAPTEARRAQGSVQAIVTGWIAFTQGRNSEFLKSVFPMPKTVVESVEVLIEGWAARSKPSSVSARSRKFSVGLKVATKP